MMIELLKVTCVRLASQQQSRLTLFNPQIRFLTIRNWLIAIHSFFVQIECSNSTWPNKLLRQQTGHHRRNKQIPGHCTTSSWHSCCTFHCISATRVCSPGVKWRRQPWPGYTITQLWMSPFSVPRFWNNYGEFHWKSASVLIKLIFPCYSSTFLLIFHHCKQWDYFQSDLRPSLTLSLYLSFCPGPGFSNLFSPPQTRSDAIVSTKKQGKQTKANICATYSEYRGSLFGVPEVRVL